MRLRGFLSKTSDVDNAILDLIEYIQEYKTNNIDGEVITESDVEYIKSSLSSAFSSIQKARTKVRMLIRTEEGDI